MSKQEWLIRLASSRDELLASFDGLSRSGWMNQVLPDWTAKDVLAHIAAWETRVAMYLPDLLADNGMRIVSVQPDAFNAEQVALRRERAPGELLNELTDSRRRILEALANASDDGLTRPRAVPWGQVTIEQWALREICDHDGEHAAQIRTWRAACPEAGRSLWDTLVDRMADRRAELLIACLGLDMHKLVAEPVPTMGAWTVKDILAHIAAWDEIQTDRAELALAGRKADIIPIEMDRRNAEIFAHRRGWSLDHVLQSLADARQRCLQVFGAASLEQLIRPFNMAGQETSLWKLALRRSYHDAMHAEPIRTWRDTISSPFSSGPRSVLLAAMDAARNDLMRQIDRIPPSERETHTIIGHWKLKDILGHLADWDLFALKALLMIKQSRPLPYVAESDVDKVNAKQAAARREQTLNQAWADFQNIRADLIGTLADWDDAELTLAVDYTSEWGRTAYGWIVGQTIWHDREHADILRTVCLSM